MTTLIHPSHYGEFQPLDRPRFCWHTHTATATASGSASGADPAWVTDGETWNQWTADAATCTLTLTFASTQPVGYVGIAVHDFDLAESTVDLQIDVGAGFVSAGFISLDCTVGDGRERPILYLMDETACDAVRLSITGTSAPSVGVFQAGRITEIPRKSTYTTTPIGESQEITYRDAVSEGGHVLAREVKRRGVAFSVDIQHLSEDWRMDESHSTRWALFQEHLAQGLPFFYTDRPSRYPTELAYAQCTEQPRFTRAIPNRRIAGSISFDCVGYKRP